MIISIWRYSHFLLALLASLFLLLLSVTGAILATAPITTQATYYKARATSEVSVSEVIQKIKNNYEDVFSVEVSKNQLVLATVFTAQGEEKKVYINPKTGKEIAPFTPEKPIYQWATSLHRSLFLKTTGRIIIGITSLLLLLISFSGFVLIVKKTKTLTDFFSVQKKDTSLNYYHTIFGKITVIVLAIVALTGVYLSLEGFSVFSKQKELQNITSTVKNNKLTTLSEISIFKRTPITQITKLEFPFSSSTDDYFVLYYPDKEIAINQHSGEIIQQTNYSTTAWLSYYSTILHTGNGTFIWAFILFFTSGAILFFMYSGFAITLHRKKNTIKNKYTAKSAEYIIAVGSENGTTIGFANLLHNALLQQNKKSFLVHINQFSSYPNCKHLIVITATYGNGEAPSNATKFYKLTTNKTSKFYYSVVGFGSTAYPHFCSFAFQIANELEKMPNAIIFEDVYTVNNQSFESFSQWVNKWANKEKITLRLSQKKKIKPKQKKQQLFTVVKTTTVNKDNTFLLYLQPEKQQFFQSGDLLSVYAEEDNRERLYSIGKINANTIVLSIKKHNKGIVSKALNSLEINTRLSAKIIKNKMFHFPVKAKQVVFIATGTGIAPFLGMLAANTSKKEIHLFWGGKTTESFDLYTNFVTEKLQTKQLTQLHLALSQEQSSKIYVQHLINNKKHLIATILKNKGVIMVCGSVIMQKDVMETIDSISKEINNKPLHYYQNNNQFLVDCY